MNKTLILDKIKKHIQDYNDADNPYDAEDALREAFDLTGKYNIDYPIMTNRQYYAMLLHSVLCEIYAGSAKQTIEIQLPKCLPPEKLKIGAEVKIRYLITKYDEEDNYGNWHLNRDYTTLVVNNVMDNLLAIRDKLYQRNRQVAIKGLPRINLPNPEGFIQYLVETASFSSMALKIIR